MQKLTSHTMPDGAGKSGITIYATPDSRFVFACVGAYMHLPCEKEIDIHHNEDIHKDEYFCPQCRKRYALNSLRDKLRATMASHLVTA